MSAPARQEDGAKKTMVLIQRGAYVDLVQGGSIDIAISPAGHHLGPADPCAPCRHRQRLQPAPRAAEAIEATPTGTRTPQGGGQDGGRAQAAPGTTIGAVVRGDEVLIAHDRTQIQQDDHVVMFLVDKVHPGSGASVPAQSLLPVSRLAMSLAVSGPGPFLRKGPGLFQSTTRLSCMIKLHPIVFTLGLVLSKLALFMWLPTLLALLTGSEGFVEFLKSVLITHGAALLCLHYGRKAEFHLGVREMFLLTTSVWVVACVFGALPFVFITHIDFADAYFETMSGVTTTGSTVLSGLDGMAHSIPAVAIHPAVAGRGRLHRDGGGGAALPQRRWHEAVPDRELDWSDKSAPRAKRWPTT